MIFSYEEIIPEDDDPHYVDSLATWLNTELDYALAQFYDISIDTIDYIELELKEGRLINELKIYALFENHKLLEQHRNRFKFIDNMLGLRKETI